MSDIAHYGRADRLRADTCRGVYRLVVVLIFAGTFLPTAALAQSSAAIYVPAQVITGDGVRLFNSPYNVTTDSGGNIIVSDTYNQLLRVFDPTGTSQIASYGVPSSNLSAPFLGAPGSSCASYTFDASNLLTVGSPTLNPGCFSSPEGVAVDSHDRIYVADTGNRRVMVFAPVASAVNGQLQFLTAFGTFGGWTVDNTNHFVQVGAEAGHLAYPSDVAIDRVTVGSRPQDRVYVLDQWNNDIEAFDPSLSSSGALQFTYANLSIPVPAAGSITQGVEPGQLAFPQGFGVDQTTGNIAVADTNNQRLQVFAYPFTGTNSGLISALVIGATTVGTDPATGQTTNLPATGSGPGQFNLPEDAAIDSQHRVWVVDGDNQRVQVFNSTGTEAFQLSNPGPDGFNYPNGINVDEAHQRVLVTNTGCVTDSLGNCITDANGNDTYQVQIWKPADLTVSFAIPALPATASIGTPVNLMVQVANTGGVPLDQVQLVVVSSNPSVALASQIPAPVSLGVTSPNNTYTFTVPITLNAPGSASFTVSAIGTHTASGTAVTSLSLTSASMTVQPALTAAISVSSVTGPTAPVQTNSAFSLSITVQNVGAVALSNVVAHVVPTGASVTGPAATSVVPSLAAGASTTWSVGYTGTAAGIASFSVSASATNAVSGAAVASAAPLTTSVQVGLAPTTSLSVTPAPNALGFWHTGITATLTAVDGSGSGIAQICYAYRALSSVVNTCQPASQLTCASRFSCSVAVPLWALEQMIALTYYSTNNANLVEPPRTAFLPIDQIPPVVQFGAPQPLPNATGWNNSTVNTFVGATDGLSGVQSVMFGGVPLNLNSPIISIGTEGQGIFATVYATDNAGNVSPAFTTVPVNIDKTPPTISAQVISSVPPTNGVYTTPVTVKFVNITDPAPPAITSPGITTTSFTASGIDPTTMPPPNGITLSSSGTSLVSWTVCDKAGNCSTASANVTLQLTINKGPQFVSLPTLSLAVPLGASTVAMPDVTSLVVTSDSNGPVTITQSLPPGTALAPGTYTLTFIASDALNLSNSSSMTFTVAGASVSGTCATDVVKFNMQKTPAGASLWFSTVFKQDGDHDGPEVENDHSPDRIAFPVGGHLFISHAVVQFGTTSVRLPDAVVTFAVPGTTPEVVFDAGVWQIKLPADFHDNAFMDGWMYHLPSAVSNDTKTTMSACFSTDKPGFRIHWQASAAAYPATSFSGDYNGLQVTPLRTKVDHDQAGTPEAIKNEVIKGGTGGGGHNYTGGYSDTGKVIPILLTR